MANILDLLSDYKRVIRNNDDISIFYVFYQIMMMIGTVLGPGSIFIMLAGSFGAAFGLDNSTSFIINLVPLILFIIICLTAKTDYQILAAQLLSVVYALVMMAVLIGILIQVSQIDKISLNNANTFFRLLRTPGWHRHRYHWHLWRDLLFWQVSSILKNWHVCRWESFTTSPFPPCISF